MEPNTRPAAAGRTGRQQLGRRVVGDNDDRRAIRAGDAHKLSEYRLRRQSVQGTGGLVREQHAWPADQCTGQGDPLLLAARHLARQLLGKLDEAKASQPLQRHIRPFTPPHPTKQQRQNDVLHGGQPATTCPNWNNTPNSWRRNADRRVCDQVSIR